MLPTDLSGMLWLRRQIAAIMDSTWAAVTTAPSCSANHSTGAGPGAAAAAMVTTTPTTSSQLSSRTSASDGNTCMTASSGSSGCTPGSTSTHSSMTGSSSGYKPDLIIANQLAYGQVGVL